MNKGIFNGAKTKNIKVVGTLEFVKKMIGNKEFNIGDKVILNMF